MGGERETVVGQQPATAGGQTINGIRIHENKGEVHFHDDVQHIKVAVPVAAWAKGWIDLRSGVKKKFQFIDPVNGTVIKIRLKKNEGFSKDGFGMKITLRKCEYSADVVALDKFTNP